MQRERFEAPRALILAVCALLLIAAAPAQQGAGPRFSDGNFEDIDWELTTLSNHPDISVLTKRQSSGGSPGPFRIIHHIVPAGSRDPGAPHVVSLHRFRRASYEPSRSGAIHAICYEEDAFVLEGFGQGQGRGMALWQSGRTYAAPLAATGVPIRWEHAGPRVFVQDDFYEVLPGATSDRNSHPDFSAGGDQIGLGFLRTNTSRAGGFQLVGAIDNWEVEINCAGDATPTPPPPSPLYLPIVLR
jgi:hypothetical protein